MDLAQEVMSLISALFIIIVGFFLLLPKMAEALGQSTLYIFVLGIFLGLVVIIAFFINLVK